MYRVGGVKAHDQRAFVFVTVLVLAEVRVRRQRWVLAKVLEMAQMRDVGTNHGSAMRGRRRCTVKP